MSMTGDVDRWVSFFCEGIRAQAQATVEKITDLLEFRQEATATVLVEITGRMENPRNSTLPGQSSP